MKNEKPYWSHCTYMGSLRILPPGSQLWRSTIIARTSGPQRCSQNGIHMILLFRLKKMRSWQQVGCWGRDLNNSGDDLWQVYIWILASLFRNAGTEIWRMIYLLTLLFPVLEYKPKPGCNPQNSLILNQIGELDWKRHVAHWNLQLRGDFVQCPIPLWAAVSKQMTGSYDTGGCDMMFWWHFACRNQV